MHRVHDRIPVVQHHVRGSAGLQHAPDLGHRLADVGGVMEHSERVHGVEVRVGLSDGNNFLYVGEKVACRVATNHLIVAGVSNWGAIFAMASLALLPVFAVFIFFQRYLVEGISTAGLSGR